MKLQRYFLGGVLMLAASVAAFGQTVKSATELESKPADTKSAAPAFSLTSLEGKKFELAALRGKVVVLNLWFTGCPPCIEEMPKLNELVDKFKDKDVVFIAPTWDNVATLQAFLKERLFKYHIIPNAAELIISTYSDGSGNVTLPTHLVIDKEGKIEVRLAGGLITKEGTKRLEDLQSAIARLVAAPSDKTK
jgi:peroxiredoxin